MWDYDHDLIPKSLNIWFNKTSCHKYNTRFVAKGKLTPCAFKRNKFGIRSFKREGTTFLNQLKDLDIYTESKSKISFLGKLKNTLINIYH